jgi:hypothetical protein
LGLSGSGRAGDSGDVGTGWGGALAGFDSTAAFGGCATPDFFSAGWEGAFNAGFAGAFGAAARGFWSTFAGPGAGLDFLAAVSGSLFFEAGFAGALAAGLTDFLGALALDFAFAMILPFPLLFYFNSDAAVRLNYTHLRRCR